MIDYGASLNVQDKRGRTPAHAGAAKGRTLVILIFRIGMSRFFAGENKGGIHTTLGFLDMHSRTLALAGAGRAKGSIVAIMLGPYSGEIKIGTLQ